MVAGRQQPVFFWSRSASPFSLPAVLAGFLSGEPVIVANISA
jgi:hypothetical protein